MWYFGNAWLPKSKPPLMVWKTLQKKQDLRIRTPISLSNVTGNPKYAYPDHKSPNYGNPSVSFCWITGQKQQIQSLFPISCPSESPLNHNKFQ